MFLYSPCKPLFFYVFRGDKKGKLTWYICPAGKYTYRNGKYLISVLHLLIGNSKNIIVLLNAIFLFNFKHTRSNQFQADVLYLTPENVRETVFLTFSGVKQFKQPEMG